MTALSRESVRHATVPLGREDGCGTGNVGRARCRTLEKTFLKKKMPWRAGTVVFSSLAWRRASLACPQPSLPASIDCPALRSVASTSLPVSFQKEEEEEEEWTGVGDGAEV